MSTNIFGDFFFDFLKPYKFLGISPFKKNKKDSNVSFSFPLVYIIVLLVLLYWLGVGLTFMEDRAQSHVLSVIANWIQVLTNAIALTVAVTYPMMQKETIRSIMKAFERVDQELNCLDIKVNYKDDTKKYRMFLLTCVIILLGTSMYDFFVTVLFLKTLKAWYWFVTILPLIVYSLALSQAFIMIGFIKKRCQSINQVMWEFLSTDKALVLNEKNMAILSILNETRSTISLSELFSKLFISLNELCELTQSVELLFGPLFLTTFGAIFAVTSIQLFYCYLFIQQVTSQNIFSICGLIQSLDIIWINLTLIIGITSVCEGVSIEVMCEI